MLPSPAGVRPATLLLPHAARSVSCARRELRAALCREDLPRAFVDDALLVLSELVSNAITHGRGIDGTAVRVSWALDGSSLRLEVGCGRAGTRPRAGDASMDATGGRGLAIVGELTGDWGVEEYQGDVTVWARLYLPPAYQDSGR